MPDVGKIIAYENGELDEDEVIELFQELIDSGLAWTLQGSYGRTAASLIDAGYCHQAGQKAAAANRTSRCQYRKLASLSLDLETIKNVP
jgi:hypothetical protein